jgi:hypothetical protein
VREHADRVLFAADDDTGNAVALWRVRLHAPLLPVALASLVRIPRERAEAGMSQQRRERHEAMSLPDEPLQASRESRVTLRDALAGIHQCLLRATENR